MDKELEDQIFEQMFRLRVDDKPPVQSSSRGRPNQNRPQNQKNEPKKFKNPGITKPTKLKFKLHPEYLKYKATEMTSSCENRKGQTGLISKNYQQFLAQFYPKYKQKGILLFHGVGSGKSCSALMMAQAVKSKYKKIIILIPASLRNTYNDEINKCGKEIIKNIEVHSYNTVQITKKVFDKDALIIVDEIQNVLNLIVNNTQTGRYLFDLLDQSNKLIFLSATPFINKLNEVMVLFHLLKKDIFGPLNKTTLQLFEIEYPPEKIRPLISGLVSYVQGNNEKNPDFPKVYNHLEYVELNDQHQIYCEQLFDGEQIQLAKKYAKKQKAIQQRLPLTVKDDSGVFAGSRQATLFDQELQIEDAYGKNLKLYSPKLHKVLQKIEQVEGPVIIYSFFITNGLQIVKEILDQRKIKSVMWIGGKSDAERKEILARFNDPNNIKGEQIKVFLISQAGAEGISLKNVRQVHILEPHWNDVKIEQIIGRAVRLCSHSDLPKAQRRVDVYRYIVNNTADSHVQKKAQQKLTVLKAYEQVIKEEAIDCYLNKAINLDVENC